MTESESAKFDAVVRKMMSVPHDEIVRRENEWKRKRQQAKKKRTQGKRDKGMFHTE